MKQLLPLLSVLFLSITLQAQNPKLDLKRLKEEAAYSKAFNDYFARNKRLTDTVNFWPSNTFYLSHPKPGVHRLPQDNMPCIVPDPTATVAIPNGWKGEIGVPFRSAPPRIPNAANPLTIAPAKPLLIPNTK